jgi:predicted dehydrogenase
MVVNSTAPTGVGRLTAGVVGCGRSARIHLERIRALPGVEIVGCADPDREASESLASMLGAHSQSYADHRQLISDCTPDAVLIFTPHRSHYRPAMDALQAGAHVFIEKPLSTNSQEAADIASLAHARNLLVGVGHQYRLKPSFAEARRRLESGELGRLSLVQAILAAPWIAAHRAPEDRWRLEPRISGGGIIADAGDHLLDILLWTTRQEAVAAAAFQRHDSPGLDLVTSASVQLAGGTLCSIGISGVSDVEHFELDYFAEQGRMRATPTALVVERSGSEPVRVGFPPNGLSIDADFVAAVRENRAPSCPGDEALHTVRLLEALIRAAASGQVVRLA